MNPKGQLLSLDFLFAIGLVFLAIGIAIKFGEMNAFEWQEKQEQMELEQYGQTAAFLLMGNPAITCEMANNSTPPAGLGVHVNNCIDTSNPAARITKAALGLPDNFQFSVFNQTDSVFISTGNNPSFQTPAVFSLQLKAIVSNGNIAKAQLYPCLQKKPECSLQEKTIFLAVWKT